VIKLGGLATPSKICLKQLLNSNWSLL